MASLVLLVSMDAWLFLSENLRKLSCFLLSPNFAPPNHDHVLLFLRNASCLEWPSGGSSEFSSQTWKYSSFFPPASSSPLKTEALWAGTCEPTATNNTVCAVPSASTYKEVSRQLPAGGHKEMSSCRLSWLTNSALVYEPKCGGRGGVAGSRLMSTAVRMEPK